MKRAKSDKIWTRFEREEKTINRLMNSISSKNKYYLLSSNNSRKYHGHTLVRKWSKLEEIKYEYDRLGKR